MPASYCQYIQCFLITIALIKFDTAKILQYIVGIEATDQMR